VIELERRAAARFRAAVRHCVIGRLVIPFALLASVDGPSGGAARLERGNKGSVGCRWLDHGQAKEVDCEPISSDSHSVMLPPLDTLEVVNPSLLSALHACGQTTSRDAAGRLALARLQLRGQDGAIVGTDGRQMLLWNGFTFPFQDNFQVPAVPIFGSRELRGEQEVRIGRMDQQVAIAAGPWTICLSIDAAGGYPDVMAVLPRTSRLARLSLDDADAAALQHDLQKVPAAGVENASVLLELGPRPRAALAGRSGCSPRAVEPDPLAVLQADHSHPPGSQAAGAGLGTGLPRGTLCLLGIAHAVPG
jgi:hypothetical protein